MQRSRTVPGNVWNCLLGHPYNDLLGSIVRVGCDIPDFYLVPHGILSRKSNLMDSPINQLSYQSTEPYIHNVNRQIRGTLAPPPLSESASSPSQSRIFNIYPIFHNNIMKSVHSYKQR